MSRHARSRLSILTRAQAVGYAVHRFGIALLIASLVWAAAVLWRQWQRRQPG